MQLGERSLRDDGETEEVERSSWGRERGERVVTGEVRDIKGGVQQVPAKISLLRRDNQTAGWRRPSGSEIRLEENGRRTISCNLHQGLSWS